MVQQVSSQRSLPRIEPSSSAPTSAVRFDVRLLAKLACLTCVALLAALTGCATGATSDVGGNVGPADTSSGDDGGTTCGSGTQSCGGKCVDTLGDRDNCGACGAACPAGQVCVAGACAAGCPSPEKNCSGACVATDTDPANCGACGTKCPAGQLCSGGKCALTCGPGFMDCVGSPGGGDAGSDASSHFCTDGTTDPFNCGACGAACAPGTKCAGGKCVTSCGGGLTSCGGSCKDLTDDFNNCGKCGATCKPGEVCSAGACGSSCGGGTTACSGSCKDLTSDAANCGGCGTACKASEKCRSGKCVDTCGAPLAVCSGSCKDLDTDSTNCGSCGTVCSAGQVCSGGVCTLTCGAAYITCGSKCVNTSIDPSNCGGCGNRCSLAHATSGCSGGACFIAFCDTGFSDCNGLASDGCEVDTSSTVTSCGGCGKTCPLPPHTTSVGCSSSTCTVGACDAGYVHLSPLYSDGCDCKDLAGSHVCTAPTNEGTVAPGTSVSVLSNMPVSGRDDFYLVTFGSLSDTSAHPHIQFTTNPGSALAFDVEVNCAGVALGCQVETGSSTGNTDWEISYAGPSPPADPTKPTFTPITGSSGPLASAATGSLIVRVYRASGAPTCDSYVLKFSN